MEQLSTVLDERQAELDHKDEIMRALQDRNDEIAALKIELENEVTEKQALQEQIDQANRDKYEYASVRSGSPPGK